MQKVIAVANRREFFLKMKIILENREKVMEVRSNRLILLSVKFKWRNKSNDNSELEMVNIS